MYIYTYIYIYIYACVNIYIYIYIHIHTHTHTHTYIYIYIYTYIYYNNITYIILFAYNKISVYNGRRLQSDLPRVKKRRTLLSWKIHTAFDVGRRLTLADAQHVPRLMEPLEEGSSFEEG